MATQESFDHLDETVLLESLLCPEKSNVHKIGSIRDNEYLYERFASSDTSVVFYIPKRFARNLKQMLTDEYCLRREDQEFFAFVIVEAKDKSKTPSIDDPFVGKHPDQTFRIYNENKSIKGMKRHQLPPLDSRIDMGWLLEQRLRPFELIDGGKESQFIETPRKRSRINLETQSSKRMKYGIHGSSPLSGSKMVAKEGRENRECYPVQLIPDSLLVNSERSVVGESTILRQPRVRQGTEMTAAYGFSGVATCRIKFTNEIPPFI